MLSTERIANDPFLKEITGMNMFPAIARNSWLQQKGWAAPEFDYDENDDVVGDGSKKAFMKRLWVIKYRLTFWFRTGWRRRFLLKHPHLMERIGHFLYYFPSTIPGWRSLMKFRQLFRKRMP